MAEILKTVLLINGEDATAGGYSGGGDYYPPDTPGSKTFSVPGVYLFNTPVGVPSVQVEMVGGGREGKSGTSASGGGGGAGGGYAKATLGTPIIVASGQIQVTVSKAPLVGDDNVDESIVKTFPGLVTVMTAQGGRVNGLAGAGNVPAAAGVSGITVAFGGNSGVAVGDAGGAGGKGGAPLGGAGGAGGALGKAGSIGVTPGGGGGGGGKLTGLPPAGGLGAPGVVRIVWPPV